MLSLYSAVFDILKLDSEKAAVFDKKTLGDYFLYCIQNFEDYTAEAFDGFEATLSIVMQVQKAGMDQKWYTKVIAECTKNHKISNIVMFVLRLYERDHSCFRRCNHNKKIFAKNLANLKQTCRSINLQIQIEKIIRLILMDD